MKLPWTRRAEAVEEKVRQADAALERDTAALEKIQAQGEEVRRLARRVEHETVEVNGWTMRAKKAWS